MGMLNPYEVYFMCDNKVQPNMGCIKNKVSLTKLYKYYERVFAAIALVHHIGATKYGYYSWYNNPLQSNSSVSDNIDAIFRHLTAHRIGKTVDPESFLPHVFHACCRAGMLITIYYRSIHEHFTPIANANGKRDISSQITAEEFLVLTKDKLVPEYGDETALLMHIFSLLCELGDGSNDTADILDDTACSKIEELVLCIWRYTLKLFDSNEISYDTDKLDMGLRIFCINNNIA
jgi:hypothetical protein